MAPPCMHNSAFQSRCLNASLTERGKPQWKALLMVCLEIVKITTAGFEAVCSVPDQGFSDIVAAIDRMVRGLPLPMKIFCLAAHLVIM